MLNVNTLFHKTKLAHQTIKINKQINITRRKKEIIKSTIQFRYMLIKQNRTFFLTPRKVQTLEIRIITTLTLSHLPTHL